MSNTKNTKRGDYLIIRVSRDAAGVVTEKPFSCERTAPAAKRVCDRMNLNLMTADLHFAYRFRPAK